MTACADPNANSQSDPVRCLQWDDTRRLPDSYGGGNPQFMERHVQCGSWSRCVSVVAKTKIKRSFSKGPAHAVYFATYEAVKHAMGGNQAGVHHPLAAGILSQNSHDEDFY